MTASAQPFSRFADKLVIVTGGNGGIGLGIAQRFADEGANLAILARTEDSGEAAAQKLSSEKQTARFYKTDLSDESNICATLERIQADFGRIDVLVNNAGCGLLKSPVNRSTPTAERWRAFRQANLDSMVLMTAHTLPHLAQSEGASVVNISSTAAMHGNWGLYGVAKAGVEGLTRAMAAEGAPMGIRVNGVSPGWIATSPEQADEVLRNATQPPSLLNRMGTPGEIAGAVMFLASADAGFVTGQTLIVDGGKSVIDYPSRGMLETHGFRGHVRPDEG